MCSNAFVSPWHSSEKPILRKNSIVRTGMLRPRFRRPFFPEQPRNREWPLAGHPHLGFPANHNELSTSRWLRPGFGRRWTFRAAPCRPWRWLRAALGRFPPCSISGESFLRRGSSGRYRGVECQLRRGMNCARAGTRCDQLASATCRLSLGFRGKRIGEAAPRSSLSTRQLRRHVRGGSGLWPAYSAVHVLRHALRVERLSGPVLLGAGRLREQKRRLRADSARS